MDPTLEQQTHIRDPDHRIATEGQRQPALSVNGAGARPEVRGKFLARADQTLHIRGVTYGTFAPGPDGHQFPSPEAVENDFAVMAAAGVNAIRTYTVPPRWLLDAAHDRGLQVMAGLPWEQHIAFLDDAEQARSIEARVIEGAQACAGHPALLALVIGNEIPAPIVRWHGRRKVERFLERLYMRVKEVDPQALVTYVNFPTTEYLQLPFLDFVAFNVYLETPEQLCAYLARLQNLTGDRPLLMAEIGLDSRRNGLERQAEVLDWQIRTTFEAGCAGAFAFAWTDEWHRGGFEIADWDFGLVDRERQPKPALEAVARAFDEAPLGREGPWPRVSVVVCSYNGAATIAETLGALARLDYPDYEVIVVDDGSTDGTGEIASRFACRLISVENGGLGHARNIGAEAASGEIVAYLDDDAYPDPDWMRYLAHTFRSTDYAAVGGPNIPPGDEGWIARAIAHAPGGPIHVLTSDREAEHIPGCNLAVRRESLEEVGGFDAVFRAAGDDVDVCWRLLDRGWRLGFQPAAAVFHHRRKTFGAYWRQQRGYGRAEAQLERKWPEKYNEAGHVSWSGRLYDGHPPAAASSSRRWRVYYGTWGTAPFQSLYDRRSSDAAHLPLMPEWYLLLALLAGLAVLGAFWAPLLLAVPFFILGASAVVAEAAVRSRSINFRASRRPFRERLTLRALTFIACLLQPAARLWGRARGGLTPWRQKGDLRVFSPRRRRWTEWREEWSAPEDWLATIEARARMRRVPVLSGGPYDEWDLETRGGVLGAVRMRMTIEEHGAGNQLGRFATSVRISPFAVLLIALPAVLASAAATGSAWIAVVVLAAVAVGFAARTGAEVTAAFGALQPRDTRDEPVKPPSSSRLDRRGRAEDV